MILNPATVILSPVVALDLETTGLQAWEEKIDLIALKTATDRYILEADQYTQAELKQLFGRISSECSTVVVHNAKFDAGFIWHHYGTLLRNLHCTQISAEICENGKQKILRKQYPLKKQGPFSLVSVLHRWLNITHANQKDKQIMQKSFIDKKLRDKYKTIPSLRKRQLEYALEDVEHLHELYEVQMKRLEETEQMIPYKLEHKLLPVLVKQEITGCLIDKIGWSQLIKDSWEPELKRLEEELDTEVNRLLGNKVFKYTTKRSTSSIVQFDIFGNSTSKALGAANELNYGSSEQLLELFKFLKQKPPIDENGKESLEEGYLSVYLTENPGGRMDKFISLLISHRGAAKRLSTYGESFLGKLDKEYHIHTSYAQTKTETGRLASRSPNLQNIPAAPKNNPNLDVRRFFIAPHGYKFITCDMDAAEVRIAADYSQEPLLLDSIRKGVDMHSQLASISYSLIFVEDTVISKSEELIHGYPAVELRDKHKSVVFAKFYKGGAKRVYGVLAEYINKFCDASQRMHVADLISKALDQRMPTLSAYLTGLINKAKKDGYLRGSSFGRIRYFDSNAYGEPANFPIQNTNAEATKMAMCNIDSYLTGKDAWIVMSIHDEICCIAKDDIAEEVAKEVQRLMANALGYFLKTIEGAASVKIAQHWKK